MANKNYVFKVTNKGVTFNDGKRQPDSIVFFEGAKTEQEALAMLSNKNATKEFVDNGLVPMTVVRVINTVSVDLTKISALKDRASLLSAL